MHRICHKVKCFKGLNWVKGLLSWSIGTKKFIVSFFTFFISSSALQLLDNWFDHLILFDHHLFANLFSFSYILNFVAFFIFASILIYFSMYVDNIHPFSHSYIHPLFLIHTILGSLPPPSFFLVVVKLYYLYCSLFWLEISQIFYMLAQLLWICMCNFPDVFRKCSFLLFNNHLWLFQSLCLLKWFLSFERRGCNMNVLFRADNSKISHSLLLCKLWLFVIIPIYCKTKLLWWAEM